MRLPIAAGLATAAVSLTLYPLFHGGVWFWTGLGAIILVAAVSVLAARPGVPLWLAPPAQALVLSVYVTAVFAGEEAWAGLVPTKDSMIALAGLLGEGFTDIQRYAAPVPVNPGIALLTAGGVGLIAMLVDLLAVRLRRAALAGLPLLALFTVPAAVMSDPIGWPAFIIAALGYVGLLTADGRERVGQWGRAVLVRRARPAGPAGASGRSDTLPLSLAGKRIGFAAIALAIGIPALLPTLSPSPLFGFGVGSGTGGGGNTITIPNPIASLRGQLNQPDNATVLTYTNNDNVPRYMRMYSLDTFDGEQWTMSQPRGRPENRVALGPLPSPPGLSASIPVENVATSVRVSEDVEGLSFLPLPYPATSVQVEGDWRADESTLMVFSTRDTAGGQEYNVASQEPQPTFETLRDLPANPSEAVAERYLSIPDSLPRPIRATAATVVQGAESQYLQAVALQDWFTSEGGFTYSLQTQGNGVNALMEFLQNKTGYCEQFAAAMAVMARTLGIPARVAIGYTGGSLIEGSWQIRTHDLHAWPELYFEGAGWLRFEPTPAGGFGQATARVPDYSRAPISTDTPGGGATPSASAAPDTTAASQNPAMRDPRDPDAGLGFDPIVTDTGLPVPARIGIGLAVAALLALLPAAWRAATRRRRRHAWARVPASTGPGGPPGVPGGGAEDARAALDGERLGAAVEATWRELVDTLRDLGLGHDPSETPRALARRLTERHELDAETAAAVARIASAQERLRYARTPGRIGSLTGDMRRVEGTLRETVSRGRRLRATLLPSSTLLSLRAAGEKVLDGFDRLENLRIRRPGRAAPPEPPARRATDDRVLAGSRD
ncbi:DUF3488 and transglutaminase-like domain-containing protein [Sphaerisporangium sp. TRM90804]|uniref:transglutaminase TgpA family protein n=1 Tax=Sphaerisporangium sp. TRM90804 TaxID=3031113 RepID=UPI00244AAE18|nr:DUF3488 and transglutaminase-like domain-containing protein [Sphaerisporangium sp. TRM90804]MDH2428623.1 DUF3488 and transglutaminase-like domain-containing protein [Sphaerisporangium sp. TRM90804]